tara:strand:- start:1925 stop:2161 length:237 start_codon:yes stop_codon:yes gene_type:complete
MFTKEQKHKFEDAVYDQRQARNQELNQQEGYSEDKDYCDFCSVSSDRHKGDFTWIPSGMGFMACGECFDQIQKNRANS